LKIISCTVPKGQIYPQNLLPQKTEVIAISKPMITTIGYNNFANPGFKLITPKQILEYGQKP